MSERSGYECFSSRIRYSSYYIENDLRELLRERDVRVLGKVERVLLGWLDIGRRVEEDAALVPCSLLSMTRMVRKNASKK